MTTRIKVTRKTARLLEHFLAHREIGSPVTGISAMHSKVGPASFYPSPARLEQARWAYSEWEVLPEEEERPRRRYYYLTEHGVLLARQAVDEYKNRKPWWKRLAKWLNEATDNTDGDD